MRYRCHVTGCQALSHPAPGEQLSVHQLPVRADIRARWCEFIGIAATEASESIRVCSRHFTEDQFKANCYQRRLIPGAIPTILNPAPVLPLPSASASDSTSPPPRTSRSNRHANPIEVKDLNRLLKDPPSNSATAMCTYSFLKRFQEELPNYTLTRDAAQNVQIKILATLPDCPDPMVTRVTHLMQVVASSHVVLTKFNSLYTTKMEELVRNIAELTAISPVLEPVLSSILQNFNLFTATFTRMTSLSQNFIVEAIEVHEKYKTKSDELHQQLLAMDQNVFEAISVRRILDDTLNELHEQRNDEVLKVVSEDDEKSNVSLEIFLINFDFLKTNMVKYMDTCLHHLCYLRNPISFLCDRIKYLKKNFGDRLEHTLVPYIISRDEKTQMIVVKVSKTPVQPTVKNEEYVIKIMQLSASLYVHLSGSEKAIVTKCLEVTACIETLSSLSVNAVATLQNIQTRIRATSKQISKLIYFTIRLMNTAIDIKESFNPVNITALITALRSVAGYTSIALESIYLVENLVKELKERRDDIKKLDDEHNFLKDTFIINLEILLEMVEKYTLVGGQHLNLSRYKLYFLREYVKQLPQPKKAELDEFKYRKKNRKQLKVATETCKNATTADVGKEECGSSHGDQNFDIESLHAAMKNVLEINFPKLVDSGEEESSEPPIKRERLSDSPEPAPVIKTEPQAVEEPQASSDLYIKPEPVDIDDDDSLPSQNEGDDMNYHFFNEEIVDGFIVREIKEEDAVDV